MSASRTIVLGLSAALTAWAGVALARPEPIAGPLGVSAGEVRALALRDLGSVVPLLVSTDARPALAMRLLFDSTDGVLYGRRRAVVALATLGAAIDIAGLVAATLERRHPPAPPAPPASR